MSSYFAEKNYSNVSLDKSYNADEANNSSNSSFEDEGLIKRPEPRGRSCFQRNKLSIICHSALITLNILFCVGFLHLTANHCRPKPSLHYTRVQDEIQYELKKWDIEEVYLRDGSVNPNHRTKYIGPPTPELDNAWEELLGRQNMILSKQDLGDLGKLDDLVELEDKSGYFATFSVYHALHCVKHLHHTQYLDYYFPNTTKGQQTWLEHHAEHCLDIIRQNLLCHPDLSVLPMQWSEKNSIPIAVDSAHHQCVNFDSVEEWIGKRSFDPLEPGRLMHPVYGQAYDYQGPHPDLQLDDLLAKHNNDGTRARQRGG